MHHKLFCFWISSIIACDSKNTARGLPLFWFYFYWHWFWYICHWKLTMEVMEVTEKWTYGCDTVQWLCKISLSSVGHNRWKQCLQLHPTELATAKWNLLMNCVFLFMLNTTCSSYFPVFQEESEIFQLSKISNLTWQPAEGFCNFGSYKHCINITVPLRETDCLCFQTSGHSLPCHKYCLVIGSFLCLHHSLWVFSEIAWSAPMPSFRRTDHRRPDPTVSWTAEKTHSW